MVRLAQDFAARYPLVEGQGNFGNIDGDNAAAMRYTEARLTEVAAGAAGRHRRERRRFPRRPMTARNRSRSCCPAAFPNLLANGAAGIAVGMATSIPPHNAGELCAAALHLIAQPARPRTADLLRHIPGPDFPTGGVLVEDPAAIREAYETGRGGFRVRAKWAGREAASTAPGRSSSRKSPTRCRRRKLIEQIAAADGGARSCRCSATCATRAPTTCASCWSRRPAASSRKC